MTEKKIRKTGMPLRFGVHAPLEDEATRLIMESLKDVKSMSAKSDILTPWKEQNRKDREVLVSSGMPDSQIRMGMFHRKWNSQQQHLNSRDGITPGRRRATLASFVEEHRADEFGDHEEGSSD